MKGQYINVGMVRQMGSVDRVIPVLGELLHHAISRINLSVLRLLPSTRMVTAGIYPPVRISKDRLYVILLSYGSRRIDSGALDEDLGQTSIIYQLINFCFGTNTVHFTVYTVPRW